MRVVARVLVVPTPLEAGGSELVGGERARAGREAAGNDDCFLSVPGRTVGHYLSVSGDVLRGELWQLVRLCVHPAERLHVLRSNKQTDIHTYMKLKLK